MRAFRTSVVALIAAGLLGGCANMPDQDRTRAEGTAAGALIGGLLGYAIDSDRGAAIGALIGAGAGYAVGNEIAKRKQAYASTEDFLDGEIARVEEFNATTVAYNARLHQEIAQLDTQAVALRADYDAGRARKDALQTQRAELARHIEKSNKLEQTLAREHEIQVAILEQEREQRPAEDEHIARLEREVQALQQNLDELREGSSQLARIDQRLSV